MCVYLFTNVKYNVLCSVMYYIINTVKKTTSSNLIESDGGKVNEDIKLGISVSYHDRNQQGPFLHDKI